MPDRRGLYARPIVDDDTHDELDDEVDRLFDPTAELNGPERLPVEGQQLLEALAAQGSARATLRAIRTLDRNQLCRVAFVATVIERRVIGGMTDEGLSEWLLGPDRAEPSA